MNNNDLSFQILLSYMYFLVVYIYQMNVCVRACVSIKSGPGLKAFDPIYVNLDTKRSLKKQLDQSVTDTMKDKTTSTSNNNNDGASRLIHERVCSPEYASGNARLLFMAPEGATHSGYYLLPFRRGAFVPGLPILPVCLQYTTCPVSQSRCYSYFNPGWTVGNTIWHVFRMLLQFSNKLKVTIMDVYEPDHAEKVR